MKIGLISDIHSNTPALEAVLDALHDHGVSEIVCAGDVLGLLGDPNEAISLVREHTSASVLGNHDTRILPGRGFIPETPSQKAEHRIITDEITDDNHEWIAGLPTQITIHGDVVIAHRRPNAEDPTGSKQGNSGVAPKEFTALSPNGSVFVIGHSHQQHAVDLSRFDGKDGVVVNPGAVGYPYSKGVARFAILDTDTHEVELLSVDYDSEPVKAHVRENMNAQISQQQNGSMRSR